MTYGQAHICLLSDIWFEATDASIPIPTLGREQGLPSGQQTTTDGQGGIEEEMSGLLTSTLFPS